VGAEEAALATEPFAFDGGAERLIERQSLLGPGGGIEGGAAAPPNIDASTPARVPSTASAVNMSMTPAILPAAVTGK